MNRKLNFFYRQQKFYRNGLIIVLAWLSSFSLHFFLRSYLDLQREVFFIVQELTKVTRIKGLDFVKHTHLNIIKKRQVKYDFWEDLSQRMTKKLLL